jgi:hypothetical protein
MCAIPHTRRVNRNEHLVTSVSFNDPHPEELDMTDVRCPECDLPAEIADRFTLAGTDGAQEHVKVVCVAGHWFTPQADDVEAVQAVAA